MTQITAVLSMLHESASGTDSATRRFRGEPVLWWALQRLSRSQRINMTAIMCWDDQLQAVEPIAADREALISLRTPRVPLPAIESVAAARRWADGWRGGLGACEFDRGFYAPWVEELRQQTGADAILLVDPSAALVDAGLIDALIDHAESHAHVDLCFSQAAPGLSGVVWRPTFLEQLSSTKTHPGQFLAYRPEAPRRDPIGTDACVLIPTPLARTTHRFTLDSERQVRRFSAATASLNGQLIGTGAEHLLTVLDAHAVSDELPREIVLELTTLRATRPVYWPGRYLPVKRDDLPLETAKALFAELASMDDVRLTLAGVGDPLLCGHVFDVIDAARKSGIPAISIETDLLGAPVESIIRLADSPVDVVSVHLPAVTPAIYTEVMGVEGLEAVIENIKIFVTRRQSLGRGAPLLVPTFTKCEINLAEMEFWYDQWLKALNCAVIIGPSDFAGQIPQTGCADMAPPRRRACARLNSRMTVLSDGQVVSCEQDVMGGQSMGEVGKQPLKQIWQDRFGALRDEHATGKWIKQPLCAGCKEWHR